MNKQRKMLIGVLLLGVGGLGIDRFVLGTPDAAAADDAEPIVAEVPAIDAPADSSTEPQGNAEQAKTLPSYASLTERLILAQEQQASDPPTEERGDPFALPKQWRTDQPKPVEPSAGGSNANQRDRINDLFKLDATVVSLGGEQDEMLAVISGGGLDGRAVRLGQKLRIPRSGGAYDEYELVEVGARYVVWKRVGTGERIKMQVGKVL